MQPSSALLVSATQVMPGAQLELNSGSGSFAEPLTVGGSGTAGAGVFVGFLVGTALKYAFAMAMVGILIAAYFF